MHRRGFLHASAGMCWVAVAARDALAQARYPDRAVRVIVPFAPGGETDLIGRIWATKTQPHLGGSLVVDNRAGAGGAIGSTEAARAKPDGYTLLAGTTTTQIINPIASVKSPYDPARDFVTVAIVSTTPTCIVVHPATPARDLKELAAWATAAPGKHSYGSAGAGTITNLTGELFKQAAGGLELQHVPYKGAGPGIQDLIAGHVPMFTPIMSSSILAHHRAGRLRVLAVNSPERLRAAPDLPTAIESGYPQMRVVVFNGVFAPTGTPQDVLNALREATTKAKAQPDFATDLEKAGAQIFADTNPVRAAQFVQDEATRWAPIIKASGFKIE